MGVSSILAGFDLDCSGLFVKFEKLSTVRYSAFAEIWREMKFSLIFSGRRVKELVCFTTEALSYTKFFLLQSTSFLRRVCALYIIYGIYYKQPVQNTSKIFVTLDEWLQIKEFAETLKVNNHLDALFILLSLIFDNAFEFSVTNTIRYTPVSCRGLIHTNYTELDDIKKLDLNNITKDLEKVERDYLEAKLKLSATLNMPYLNYGNDNFSKDLKEILTSSTSSKTSKITNIAKPGTSKQTNDSFAEKRRLLREKSFKKKNKSTLYRSTVVGDDDSVSDDEFP